MAAVSISVTVTTTDPTVIIPEDAKIYNNHATAGGDDIYVSEGVEGPQLRFGPVGADWMLDDCEHLIDGWYQDGADNRWSAHDAPVYAKLYTPTGEAVNGLLALKAAHGLAHTVTIHYLERETEKGSGRCGHYGCVLCRALRWDLSEYLDKDIRGYRQVAGCHRKRGHRRRRDYHALRRCGHQRLL